MGIECTTPQSVIDDLLDAIPEIVSGEIVRAFSYLGEQCVKRIRDRTGSESWFDQSGNLRSSVGYAVYGEGRKLIESAFEVVGHGNLGSSEGKKMIDELASKYSQTYALAVVAGMDYADYVEAKENKDVLASAELWAKSQIDQYLRQALARAEGKLAKLQQQLGL